MDRVNLHCYTVIEYQHQERQSKIETVKLNYYTVQADLLDCKKLSFKDRKFKNKAKLNCYTIKEQHDVEIERRKRVRVIDLNSVKLQVKYSFIKLLYYIQQIHIHAHFPSTLYKFCSLSCFPSLPATLIHLPVAQVKLAAFRVGRTKLIMTVVSVLNEMPQGCLAAQSQN